MTEERKIKVLIVEDERDIRENMVEILRDEGFEVVEAENGRQGFEVFLQQKPDVIVSDIMMPEVDGYGLLSLIRENKNIRNNNVPFIFLSALGQKENVIKGVNLSANDYLVKPVDFDLMIAKIREKTVNASRVAESHDRTIKNIKDQITVILPANVFAYLDVITQVSEILKKEPHGPLPHRKYLEDFNKIYLNALKLRASISNSLDESVIDYKLNTKEEILPLFTFLSELISGLSDKFKNSIQLEKSSDEDLSLRIKIDRLTLLHSLRKIFAGMLKADPTALINVRLMRDHLDQMLIIFYLKSQGKNVEKNVNLHSSLNEKEISKILDQQSCRFEIDDRNNAILTIPSHRSIF